MRTETEPTIRRVPGSTTEWETVEAIYVPIPGGGLTVPAHSQTDGATIPRWLWWIVGHPFQPVTCRAAIVHDYFCRLSWSQRDYTLRVFGDALFLRLMKEDGAPFWKRAAFFLGVLSYGLLSYWWSRRL